MQGVDRLAAGVAPVGEENLVEQLDGGTLDDRAEVAPALLERPRPHVLEREVVAAEDDTLLVEHGDLAMIAEIRRAAPLQHQHWHEALHLAAGLPEWIHEAAAAQETTHGVEQQPYFHPLARALRQQFHDPPPRVIATENEGHQVDRMSGPANLPFELGIRLLAAGEKTHGVSAHRRAPAFAHEGLGDGPGRGGRGHCGRVRGHGRQARLAGDEAPEFAAAEEQVERHADVGDQDDDEQPRHGVARLALFAHEARDQKHREQEPADRQQVAQDLGIQRGFRLHDGPAPFWRLVSWRKAHSPARSGTGRPRPLLLTAAPCQAGRTVS